MKTAVSLLFGVAIIGMVYSTLFDLVYDFLKIISSF